MPMSTIIFVDFWLSRRLGFQLITALGYTVLSRMLHQPAAHLAAVSSLGRVITLVWFAATPVGLKQS